MKKQISFVAAVGSIVLLLSTQSLAQPPDSLWSRAFHFSAVDICYSVCEASGGGYLLAGMTLDGSAPDFRVLKTDENGDSLWSRTYGRDGSDVCYSVLQTSDGGYVLAGQTQSFGAGHCDFWLLKIDENGDSLWSRTYGGLYRDNSYCVRQTSDGGYILAGVTYTFSVGGLDFWLVKTDENGDSLWSHAFGGAEDDRCFCVQQTSDGGYILAGETRSFGAYPFTDFWVVKTDANGDSLWSKTFGGDEFDECQFAEQTSDGGYILAGNTNSFGAGYTDFWLVKTDANGDSVWSRTYGGMGTELCTAAQITQDEGYIMAGWIGYDDRDINMQDFLVVKADASGDSVWSRVFDSRESEECNAIQQTSDGGYVLAGWTYSPHPLEQDYWLAKVESEQELERPQNLTIFLNDTGQGAVVRWVAPLHCDYLIYSTTNPNHDGDPPGPGWTLEAALPGVPAGPAEWTDSDGLDEAYRNYVIVANRP